MSAVSTSIFYAALVPPKRIWRIRLYRERWPAIKSVCVIKSDILGGNGDGY